MIKRRFFMGISEIVGFITVGFIVVYFVWMFIYEDKDTDQNKVLDYDEEDEKVNSTHS